MHVGNAVSVHMRFQMKRDGFYESLCREKNIGVQSRTECNDIFIIRIIYTAENEFIKHLLSIHFPSPNRVRQPIPGYEYSRYLA